MTRLKRFALLLIFLLLGITTTSATVLACSQVELSFSAMAGRASVVVHGQLVETDIALQNYVLKVDTYLSGETGPEYLIISYNSPMTIQGLLDTNLSGDSCERFYVPLPLNEPGYFILVTPWGFEQGADAFGVYQHGYFDFIPDSAFPANGFIYGYEPETDTYIEYRRDELEQLFFDLHQSEPLAPLPNSRYPATAPLLVMTEAGEEYILPVTGRYLKPVPDSQNRPYMSCSILAAYSCPEAQYAAVSADGRTVILHEDDHLVYQMCNSTCRHFEFQADNFRLSPIGLAGWQGDTLTVYALHDAVRYASDGYSSRVIPRQITQFTFEPDALANADHSAWSADGQLLAFSDARGLWLWDVFTPESEPRLLIPAGRAIPVALEFSGRSRYLSIEQGGEKFIMDLINHKRLPFGYISPDERLMLDCVVDDMMSATAQRPLCVLQLHQLAPYSKLPGWGAYVEAGFRVQWVNDRRVLVQFCDYELKRCGILDANAYELDTYLYSMAQYDIDMSPYIKFDLLPMLDFAVNGRNVAILVDENTVEVNGDTLNFELDSPIVALRWLPLVFYGESPYPPVP
jgi:hypothetical protein